MPGRSGILEEQAHVRVELYSAVRMLDEGRMTRRDEGRWDLRVVVNMMVLVLADDGRNCDPEGLAYEVW